MEEELIKHVQCYPVLYNFRNRRYRNVVERKKAWDEIGAKMGKPGKLCKDTWNKLRNAYTNAVSRRKTKTGDAAKKMPKWTFEDQMAFLTATLAPRRKHRKPVVISQHTEKFVNAVGPAITKVTGTKQPSLPQYVIVAETEANGSQPQYVIVAEAEAKDSQPSQPQNVIIAEPEAKGIQPSQPQNVTVAEAEAKGSQPSQPQDVIVAEAEVNRIQSFQLQNGTDTEAFEEMQSLQLQYVTEPLSDDTNIFPLSVILPFDHF